MLIEDIIEYTNCPQYYKYKREHKGQDKYNSIIDKYTIELRKIVYYFFNEKRNEGFIKLYSLQNTWSKLWHGERKRQDILIPIDNPIQGWYSKREKDGRNILFNLHELFNNDDYIVIAVNLPFTLKLHNILLEGNIPLVRLLTKENKIQIIDFRLSDTNTSFSKDLLLTAYSIAYKELFNENADLLVYELDKNKLITTKRNENDIELFYETITDILRNMKYKLYYRHMNKQCSKCPYAKECFGRRKKPNDNE